jgi:hypothetical protein
MHLLVFTKSLEMSIVLGMEFEFQGKKLNDENIVLNNWIFSFQFANKCRKILEDFDKF